MSAATAEPKVKSSKISNDQITELLFQQVEPVANLMKTVVVNVYDNRYRINVWQNVFHPFMPNCGVIAASYFVKVENGKIEILGSSN